MSVERGIGWARGVGFVLGVILAVTAVLGWTVPRGTGHLGADVVIGVLETGELHLSQTTPIVTASGLRPGGSSDGSVEVRNISASRLVVSVAAEPSISDLDRLLWVALAAGGKQLFRGPIGDLRDGSERRFTISPGQLRTLNVRTWLPSDVGEGFEGRIDQVNLTLRPQVVDR